jgi:SAM-dependent methyltransferase
MELTTVQQLAGLNRRFYEDHAAAYARARATPQPGIQRILALIPQGARVLEIGCGDGKAARALAAHANVSAYLGLDLSPALLDRARVNLAKEAQLPDEAQALSSHETAAGHSPREAGMRNFSFALADLTDLEWPHVLPPEPFTFILAFAVFHHLPGGETRAQVLRNLGERLAPGGALVMSNWQFVRSPRLQRHIVPWSTLNLSGSAVEPGDYLITWERHHRRGLRYVHLLDEAEARQLAEAARLHVVEVFHSDGVSNDLADYVIMHKSE